VFKGERFTEKSILDIKTHYKPLVPAYGGKKRLIIKGEAIRLLRTNP